MSKLVFRKATIFDASLIYDWRNDPLTSENSINKEKFSFESHNKWLKENILSKEKNTLIFSNEMHPIGIGRADFESDYYKLSWSVSPESRGLGYGTQIVKQLIEEFSPVIAEIKCDNIVSQKIAEKAGMKFYNQTENNIMIYKLIT